MPSFALTLHDVSIPLSPSEPSSVGSESSYQAFVVAVVVPHLVRAHAPPEDSGAVQALVALDI